MITLKKYKFTELYTMSSGISSKPEQAGHGAPFISFSTVFNNYFLPDILTDLMDTSEKEQEIYSIRKGDILLTRTSETIDELGMSCVALNDYPKATFSGFTKRLRPTQTEITYDKFMGFYLRSQFFRKLITTNAFLTLRASLNEAIFSYLYLYLPDYSTQKKIGDFLYLLNKKIEINQRINSELEAVIKTLYNYWFVQFDFPNEKGEPYKSSGGNMVWNKELKKNIPEGWNCHQLSEIVSRIGTGLNPRKNFKLGNGNNYYVTIKNIDYGRVILDRKCDKVDDESLKRINKRSDLQAGDVLFTSIEPVGRTYLLQEKPENWNINESVFTIRPDYEKITPEYLYLLLSGEEMRSFAHRSSAGSIFKGIRIGALNTYKLAYSSKKLILEFSKVVEPLLKRIRVLEKETQNIIELRDWLLPMLMNGQITVTGIDTISNSKNPKTFSAIESSGFVGNL